MGSSPVGSTKKKLSHMRQLFSAFEELYEAIRHADRSLRRFAAWDCRGIRRMRPTMCTSTRERALCVCTHVCPRMADCLRAKKKRAFLLSLYCGRWDLNPHYVAITGTGSLRVCHSATPANKCYFISYRKKSQPIIQKYLFNKKEIQKK